METNARKFVASTHLRIAIGTVYGLRPPHGRASGREGVESALAYLRGWLMVIKPIHHGNEASKKHLTDIAVDGEHFMVDDIPNVASQCWVTQIRRTTYLYPLNSISSSNIRSLSVASSLLPNCTNSMLTGLCLKRRIFLLSSSGNRISAMYL